MRTCASAAFAHVLALCLTASSAWAGTCPYKSTAYPAELTAIDKKIRTTPPVLKLDQSDRLILLAACSPANLAHDVRDTKKAIQAGGEVLETEATYNPDRGVLVAEHAKNAAGAATKVAPGAFSKFLGAAARAFSGVLISGCITNIEMWEHGFSHEERVAYFEKTNEYLNERWTVDKSADPSCVTPAMASSGRWLWTHLKHQMNGASKALESVLKFAKGEEPNLAELDRVDQLTAQEIDRVLAQTAARLKKDQELGQQATRQAIERMGASARGAELNTVK